MIQSQRYIRHQNTVSKYRRFHITCVWHTCICTTHYKNKSTFRSCLYLEKKKYTPQRFIFLIITFLFIMFPVGSMLFFALCRCPQAHIVARLILSYFWKKSRIFCRYNSGATYGLQRCFAPGMMTSSFWGTALRVIVNRIFRSHISIFFPMEKQNRSFILLHRFCRIGISHRKAAQ